MFYEQDTQPIPVVCFSSPGREAAQERYRRLKAFSDITGVRLLFVYLSDEKQRLKAVGKKKAFAHVLTQGGRSS